MLEYLLPPCFDNVYRGHRIALWLFVLLLFMKVSMSINSIFNGVSVITTADGIPIATYPAGAAQTIVSLFALMGFSRLILCALSVLVLVRYRSMVPLMFALFLVEHLGRKLIAFYIPIIRVGAPPASAVNLVLLALMFAGLPLSLWIRGHAAAHDSPK